MADDRILKLILNVAHNASPLKIENAAKDAQRVWNPDKWTGISPQQMNKINEIFNTVTDIRKNPSGLNPNQIKDMEKLGSTLLTSLAYIGQELGGVAVNICLNYLLGKILEIFDLGKDDETILTQIKKMLDSQAIKIISHNSTLFANDKESAFDSIIIKVNSVNTKKLCVVMDEMVRHLLDMTTGEGAFSALFDFSMVNEISKDEFITHLIKTSIKSAQELCRKKVTPETTPETIPIHFITGFLIGNLLKLKIISPEKEKEITKLLNQILFKSKYRLEDSKAAKKDTEKLIKRLEGYILAYFGSPISDGTAFSLINLENLPRITEESYLMVTKKELLLDAIECRQPITDYITRFELIKVLLLDKIKKGYAALSLLKSTQTLDGDAQSIEFISNHLPYQLELKFRQMLPVLYSLYNSHGGESLGEINKSINDDLSCPLRESSNFSSKQSYTIKNIKYNDCYLRNDRGWFFSYSQPQVYCDATSSKEMRNWQIIKISPTSKFFVIRHKVTGLYMTSNFKEYHYTYYHALLGGVGITQYRTVHEDVILGNLSTKSIWSIELTNKYSENYVQLRAVGAVVLTDLHLSSDRCNIYNPKPDDPQALLHANSFFKQVSVYRSKYNSEYEQSRTWELSLAPQSTPKR